MLEDSNDGPQVHSVPSCVLLYLDQVALLPNRDALCRHCLLFSLGSEEPGSVSWHMTTTLLKLTQPILRTVRLLVVNRVEEFDEIAKHGVILLESAPVLHVDAVFDVLLDGTGKGSIRLVD